MMTKNNDKLVSELTKIRQILDNHFRDLKSQLIGIQQMHLCGNLKIKVLSQLKM